MKIFDCTTYFEEDLIMDIRFNILNEYVDKFIVCESRFSHSGKKKNISFDLNKFKKFQDKIEHVVVEDNPDNLEEETENLNKNIESKMILRSNSVKRINYQRNQILKGLKDAKEDDIIMYSDNDEIPNLKGINFNSIKEKIILFKQKIFYYKLNLLYPKLNWYGTKCCRYKNLKKISWLRDIKTKKYPLYRIDVLFSDLKYIKLKIIENGGWHFSNLKNPEELLRKYLNDEMHAEFEQREIDINNIKDFINRKVINYNHFAKQKSDRQSSEFKLKKITNDILPKYIIDNYEKYKDWFD